MRRFQRRQNAQSGEFILIWEQQVSGNETIRASARLNLNSIDPFVKFDVELNGVPISKDKVGKDVIVDWYFLDGFDTGKNLWVDSNGLQMIDKQLYHRKEFTYAVNNNTVSANYYPVTSAIAIRDANKSAEHVARAR